MEIRRGTWFLAESMQPIDQDMAEPIEKHHLSIFRSQTIPETAVFSDKESSKKPSPFFIKKYSTFLFFFLLNFF